RFPMKRRGRALIADQSGKPSGRGIKLLFPKSQLSTEQLDVLLALEIVRSGIGFDRVTEKAMSLGKLILTNRYLSEILKALGGGGRIMQGLSDAQRLLHIGTRLRVVALIELDRARAQLPVAFIHF